MKNSSKFLLLFGAAGAAACGREFVTEPGTEFASVPDVVIKVSVPGPCVTTTCGTAAAPDTTLGLITVVNNGVAKAYVEPCGHDPALSEQKLVNGRWEFVGPRINCPDELGPVVLASGDSVQVNEWFAAGTWRMVLDVGNHGSLDDEVADVSAPFTVP